MLKLPVLYIIFLCSMQLVSHQTAYSQRLKDSAAALLTNLHHNYKENKLTETVYLDSVYVTMRSLLSNNVHFTNKELLTLLTPYRKVIWQGKNKEEHQRKYYGILSNQAQLTTRYGEMLYYGEKIEQLEQQLNNRPSLTALSIIADYYLVHQAYEKVKSLFEKNKSFLQSIPSLYHNQKLNVSELVQAAIMLEKSAHALYELKDTLAGKESEKMIEEIAVITHTKHANNHNVIANINYLQQDAAYYSATARNNSAIQQNIFLQMEELLNNTNTPEYLKYYIQVSLVDRKVRFYLNNSLIDSAAHYLNTYEALIKEESIPYNQHLLKKFKATAEYQKGLYKHSADLLKDALAILDTSRSGLVQNIDEMLYAQAKAEEQQLLLDEAKDRSKKTEQYLLLAGTGIIILLSGSLLAIRYIRQQQKSKFLEFKLNLARNIHDETNPALLYAKALAKADQTALEKNALEKHIDHTMELIRSLSHDLQSDKQYTLSALITQTEDILKKLETSGDFSYQLDESVSKKRFISHYQYSQLKAIINECITNTIKHALFDKITIKFEQAGNKLTIIYSDNGRGWEETEGTRGIGMQNMKERTMQLNGDWEIQNNYPNGYLTTITITLR